jgi:hypothetical protein
MLFGVLFSLAICLLAAVTRRRPPDLRVAFMLAAVGTDAMLLSALA